MIPRCLLSPDRRRTPRMFRNSIAAGLVSLSLGLGASDAALAAPDGSVSSHAEDESNRADDPLILPEQPATRCLVVGRLGAKRDEIGDARRGRGCRRASKVAARSG